jgi:hypothetical protein
MELKSVPVRVLAPVLTANLIDWERVMGAANVTPNRLLLWRSDGGFESTVDAPPPYQTPSIATHARDSNT